MKELFVQSNRCIVKTEEKNGRKTYSIDFKFSIKDHLTNSVMPMIITSIFKEGETPTVVVNEHVFG